MASLRADIIDGMLADAGISAIVGNRIFPIIFTFEDMQNNGPNKYKFPMITVEMLSREQENNLTVHDHLYNASLQISLYWEVKTNQFRSRVNAPIVAARTAIRNNLDTLYDAVEIYLRDTIRGAVIGDHNIRNSHIQNTVEEEFRIDKNRTIISDRLNYVCTFSK